MGEQVGGSFILCEHCGKKLIVRMPNGLWKFQYGGKRSTNGNVGKYIPVEIFIHGNVKIKCMRRDCQKWNILNYFPNFQSTVVESSSQSAPAETQTKTKEVKG